MSASPAIAPAGGACFIELEGLCKAFDGNAVLRGVDLAVRRGEVLTILGGSGSGKSVMLKHMIGLLRADAGTVRVAGRDVTRLRETEWIEVRKHVGYVFQGAALFDSLSVYENIAYPLREHERFDEARLAARVAACLEAVGLPGIESRMPDELSGGMRKRVGVARAIALEPEAILYDEPTTGLDPANSRRIGGVIRSLQERLRVTSVVVTHDKELCYAVSDRVALLHEGRVAEEGPMQALRAGELPVIHAFLEGEIGEGDDAGADGARAPGAAPDADGEGGSGR